MAPEARRRLYEKRRHALSRRREGAPGWIDRADHGAGVALALMKLWTAEPASMLSTGSADTRSRATQRALAKQPNIERLSRQDLGATGLTWQSQNRDHREAIPAKSALGLRRPTAVLSALGLRRPTAVLSAKADD